MKYYQDITLLPDIETDLYFLWQKVYLQVHLALVGQKDGNGQVTIGISFPNYQYSPTCKYLGNKLRIFAPSLGELNKLDVSSWLTRLTDYIHVTQVREIPEKVEGYACFSRKSVKSNKERIARRKAKRENISFEQAIAYLQSVEEQKTDLPFIKMKSLSGNEPFPLFIAQTKCSEIKHGKFNCYGLSKVATVPWF